MRALAIVVLAGCFDPKLAAHLKCAQPDNWCPPSQTCGADGFCGGGSGLGGDAGDGGLPASNLVFTSSEPLNLGSMTNAAIIAMADDKCQMLGTKLRAGTYIAWLGTDPSSAATRLPANVSWARVDGKPFTSSIAALQTEFQVLYPARIDDDGADVPGARNNTAVVTQLPPSDGCTGSHNTVVVGRADGDTPDWYDETAGLTCETALYLYCFETDRRVSTPPPVLDPGVLYAFVTSGANSLAGGIGALDNACQAAADGASLGRTFRAFVAPSGASASSRFTPSPKPWSRLDGVIVANPDLSGFLAPLSMDEMGMHLHVDVAFGANSPTTPGSDANNCANWTGSGSIAVGKSTRSSAQAFSSPTSTSACTSAFLYCLEVPP